MLDAGGVQDDATGVYIALDDYSRRILQVFTNQALHEVVQRRDYPAVAKILSQHRQIDYLSYLPECLNTPQIISRFCNDGNRICSCCFILFCYIYIIKLNFSNSCKFYPYILHFLIVVYKFKKCYNLFYISIV